MAPKAVSAVAAQALMPALGRQRGQSLKFEASLVCSEKPCLKEGEREGGRENNRFQTDALGLQQLWPAHLQKRKLRVERKELTPAPQSPQALVCPSFPEDRQQ